MGLIWEDFISTQGHTETILHTSTTRRAINYLFAAAMCRLKIMKGRGFPEYNEIYVEYVNRIHISYEGRPYANRGISVCYNVLLLLFQ